MRTVGRFFAAIFFFVLAGIFVTVFILAVRVAIHVPNDPHRVVAPELPIAEMKHTIGRTANAIIAAPGKKPCQLNEQMSGPDIVDPDDPGQRSVGEENLDSQGSDCIHGHWAGDQYILPDGLCATNPPSSALMVYQTAEGPRSQMLTLAAVRPHIIEVCEDAFNKRFAAIDKARDAQHSTVPGSAETVAAQSSQDLVTDPPLGGWRGDSYYLPDGQLCATVNDGRGTMTVYPSKGEHDQKVVMGAFHGLSLRASTMNLCNHSYELSHLPD